MPLKKQAKIVNDALNQLSKIKSDHFELGSDIMKINDGAIFMMDLFSFAVLNRSLCLMIAFIDLMRSKNFVAAAPKLLHFSKRFLS